MNSDVARSLESLKPEDLQHYLSRSGWVEQTFRRDDQIKFAWNQDQDISLVVPKNARSSDYGFALGKVLRTLSQVESRPEEDVLKNIVSPNIDIIKFRFMGPSADVGSLPLRYATSAVSSIRDALIYSACSEFTSSAAYSRQLKPAIEIIDKSRFGQTEFGSFVITVEMPLDVPLPVRPGQQADLNLPTPSPIQRRTVARILRGAEKARRVALQNDQVDPENDYKVGLNANLAEALSSLKLADHDLTIELSAQWDRSLPIPTDVPTAPIVIEERTFGSLQSIGNLLRGATAPRTATIYGKIVGLNRDESDEDDLDADHTITIRTSGDNDLPRNIKVILTPEDYDRACDWHKAKRQIMIAGNLERPGKSWVLTGYTNFGVAQQE